MKAVKHLIKSDLYINNKSYTALNLDQVIVGVENENSTEIVKDETTGLNKAVNAVDPVEVYNKFKQLKSNYFILDLETGGRGWYPGSFLYGDILDSTSVYKEPSETSEIISTIENSSVKILDMNGPKSESPYGDWLKIKFDITGYVKKSNVTNLRYTNL